MPIGVRAVQADEQRTRGWRKRGSLERAGVSFLEVRLPLGCRAQWRNALAFVIALGEYVASVLGMSVDHHLNQNGRRCATSIWDSRRYGFILIVSHSCMLLLSDGTWQKRGSGGDRLRIEQQFAFLIRIPHSFHGLGIGRSLPLTLAGVEQTHSPQLHQVAADL